MCSVMNNNILHIGSMLANYCSHDNWRHFIDRQHSHACAHSAFGQERVYMSSWFVYSLANIMVSFVSLSTSFVWKTSNATTFVYTSFAIHVYHNLLCFLWFPIFFWTFVPCQHPCMCVCAFAKIATLSPPCAVRLPATMLNFSAWFSCVFTSENLKIWKWTGS